MCFEVLGVMRMQYTYLFPFEKVRPCSRIVLYGAGIMGIEYLKQLLITGYGEVLCFIDRDYAKFVNTTIPVYSLNRLVDLDFDYVVIALRTRTFADSVCESLVNIGIPKEKIVCVLSRAEPDMRKMLSCISPKSVREGLLINSPLAISLKLKRSLGDNIIHKKLVCSILKLLPTATIDIYSPLSGTLMKNLYHEYLDVGRIRLIQDSGYLYEQNMKKYLLSLSIYDYIQIDFDNIERIKHMHAEFYRRIKLLKKRCQEEQMDSTKPTFIFFSRALKKQKNCYTVFDYDGVFDISDKSVDIFIDPAYMHKFEALNISNYITIHYGNNISDTEEYQIAKQWPLGNFSKLIAMLKEKIPAVSIIQLGEKDTVKIDYADQYILGEEIELIEHILKRSLLHIDIEGGLVHLATQLGTRCVVLFGPTPVEYWGYDSNINIKAGKCHNCYGMYTNINVCARGLKKPECMWSITPEMVAEKIEECLIQ